MYGWVGTVLEVDLSRREIRKKPLEESFALKWLGGEGFGAKVLWDEVGPEVEDGLDPRNVLIYASGPFTGTLAPSSGRLEIITKSALTGIFGDSNSGGHFAPEFKQAGYDFIVIRGKADRPVYLWIDDEQVEIREASHLWGKTIPETDALLKEEIGDKGIQVSCIGPAGENLVRFAAIANNLVRAAGWGGVGAVAGSKKLKAIAVRGTKGIRAARPEEFEKACLEARRNAEKTVPWFAVRRKMGTMYLVRLFYLQGNAALCNSRISQCSQEYLEKVSGEKWVEDYVIGGALGCYGCPVHCSHFATVREGPYQGLASEGFEFAALGPYLFPYGSPDLAFAAAAAKYCNDYGMDTTEPAVLMAWATDCFKRGIITEKDTDGLRLEFGDERVGLELLRKMAYREGFGDLLAEGLYRASMEVGRGSEHYAYCMKGRPNWELNVRTSYAFAIAAALSTRGSDHLKGWPRSSRMLPLEKARKLWGHPKAGDHLCHEGKASMTIQGQCEDTLTDCLGTCKFTATESRVADYSLMLSPLLGIDLSPKELIDTANRVWNLEQAFNVRIGIRREDDLLPTAYCEEPINAGRLKGFRIEKEKFDSMLDEYYQLRGWDLKTGIPGRQTLEKLGLEDVANELETRKILPVNEPPCFSR